MKNLETLIFQLRKRLFEFYTDKSNVDSSIHLNAINIAVSLADYACKTSPSRPISKEEEVWFSAGFYIDQILGNSEWEDLANLYYDLISIVKSKNYFR